MMTAHRLAPCDWPGCDRKDCPGPAGTKQTSQTGQGSR
jgi:hypothetical protein